ncbi:MAG: sulfatase [Bacteroidota bacterium]|nr:sulfatase [Bacteroidota bacterium]MDE2957748.1 sulfatase [Bacteroidota bacterium]
MRRFLVITAAILAAGCLERPDPAVSGLESPPNIIIIFADDLGYGDLGVYGNPTIRTPHLDRMASEGMRFTQFYTGSAVCTPSRAALLTGRLPVRTGMAHDRIRVLFPPSEGGLPASEITIAEGLKQRGYATAAIGKWHLGHRAEHLPTRHGFDEFFGIPYSNDMSPANSGGARAQTYPPLPLIRGEDVIEEEPDQRLLTRRITEEALSFIRTHRDEPFFLFIPHPMPHIPIFASDAFEGNSSRGLYGDVIEELDWSTGEILNLLREEGLDQKTLVVFTSDNGPWLTVGLNGGTAGLLHDGKGTTWEGGMRVPMIAWWPGRIAAGGITQSLGTTMDLLPTVFGLAQVALPGDRDLDGVDLAPTFEDPSATVRDVVYFYRGTRLFAVRKGPWKMHYITQSAYVGDTPVTHDPPALYHLERDPSERFNVAADHPDIVRDIELAVAAHQDDLVIAPTQLSIPAWEN